MTFAEYLMTMTWLCAWLAGTVYAAGFWLTTAAVFFPPYAWYLVAERLLTGWCK